MHILPEPVGWPANLRGLTSRWVGLHYWGYAAKSGNLRSLPGPDRDSGRRKYFGAGPPGTVCVTVRSPVTPLALAC